MTSSFDIHAYSDALVVLGTAGIVVPLVRRWGINAVLGYLGAGALLGPFGLGALIPSIPPLYWFTVVDPRNVEGIAELGVVFLMFMIGLGLTFQRLVTMRRLVLGFGSLQVLLSSLAIGAIASFAGEESTAAIILGASLSLSSTAIVLEVLSSEGRLATSVGRTSFAVLLAQDIAVIPILMFIAIAGASSHGSVLTSLARALLQALAAVAIIVVLGRFLMRPLFRLVATTGPGEVFTAAVLFVIVGAGVIAHQAGLSMALGAFIAGLLLAETEYGKAIQATVEPFKGLLLGIFFFTVGMNIDLRELLREPLLLLALVACLIGLKTLLVVGLGKLFRLSWASAMEVGLLLGPAGEFALVGISLAAAAGLLAPRHASVALVVASLSMVLIPLLGSFGRRLRPFLSAPKPMRPELAARPEIGMPRAIIVGYGRVGRVVAALLKQHGVAFIATDRDAGNVTRERQEGHDVYFGDASDPVFLKSCGLMEATAIIITINERGAIDEIVHQVRVLRSDILIVARARDADHARHLYSVGATDAVPETVEASLQLSEAALVGLGVAMGPAIATIHEARDGFRRQLQSAARKAGRNDSYIIKRKARTLAGPGR